MSNINNNMIPGGAPLIIDSNQDKISIVSMNDIPCFTATASVLELNKEQEIIPAVLYYLKANQENKNINLNQRSVVNICCVIDTSYSMNEEVSIKNESNNSEKTGLSQLDLVKHSLTTIIHTLSENDYLSIVAFSFNAKIILPVTIMNEEGKLIALLSLTKLRPDGNTNLWAGLEKGMNLLMEYENQAKIPIIQSIFLLTDGCPNVDPPRGHIPTLEKFLNTHEDNFHGSIHTFGFGYHLDTPLLAQIAELGHGSYLFIPDASFVGTIFIHAMANLLCTSVNPISLIRNGSKNDLKQIKLDCQSIFHGRTRHIIDLDQSRALHFEYNKYDSSRLQFCKEIIPISSNSNLINNNNIQKEEEREEKKEQVNQEIKDQNEKEQEESENNMDNDYDFIILKKEGIDLIELEAAKFRYEYISLLRLIQKLGVTNLVAAQQLIQEFIQKFENKLNKESKFIEACLNELKDQVTQAVSRDDWFHKWGRHYLCSLTSSHNLEVCSNFKDPGLQMYTNPLFEKIRTEMEALFCQLPPPTPSIKSSNYQSFNIGNSIINNSINTYNNMSRFNDRGGGCFHSSTLLTLSDNSKKLIHEIKPGDIVKGGIKSLSSNSDSVVEDALVQVKYIIKTQIKGKNMFMHFPNTKLIITPWHPLFIEKEWTFPIDHILGAKSIDIESGFMFNLVLDCINEDKQVENKKENTSTVKSQQTAIGVYANDILAITLGHGIEEDAIATHDYFGSERIIQDIEILNGNGIVDISPDLWIRDMSKLNSPINGLKL